MHTLRVQTEFLRVADVCELLGLNRRTVYHLIASGELHASKLGGQYFFERAEIESAIRGAR